MKTDENNQLLETLTKSQLYCDYERAFTEATGLPVSLRAVESWQLPLHGKRHENEFCSMMAGKSRSCAACLQVQQQVADAATHGAHTVVCSVGLCDTAVPVRLGERLIGYLQTGQIFRKKPSLAQFERAAKQVAAWGVDVDMTDLRDAYFGSRVLSGRQYDSMVKLLEIFAEHISILSNQIMLQKENSEAPVITKAKAFIEQHQGDDLSLGQVAKAVNTSTFYFCKIFKKATGFNFTEYVSRVRIEKAKNLLLNPNLRISEIAFQIGFQSLTHFNRIFKRITGQSPTEYREQLPNTI